MIFITNNKSAKTEVSIRFPDWKAKAVTFSYDDGVLEDVKLVELFNKYGVKGTFNINSGSMGARKLGIFHARLDLDTVSKIYTSGEHEVAMHTLTHPFLTKMNSAAVIYEVMQDKINLEKLTGAIVRGFAYPYGVYNDEIVDLLGKLCVTYARTVNSTGGFSLPDNFLRLNPTCHHFDENLMKYAEEFINKSEDELTGRDPYLFYVWGHAYEFEDLDRWDVIENLLKTVSGKNNVWYATNIEIFDYINDFKRLIFNAERTRVFNPSSKEIYFEKMGEKYSVKAGQTIEILH